jgi:hypothetical protein
LDRNLPLPVYFQNRAFADPIPENAPSRSTT